MQASIATAKVYFIEYQVQKALLTIDSYRVTVYTPFRHKDFSGFMGAFPVVSSSASPEDASDKPSFFCNYSLLLLFLPARSADSTSRRPSWVL
jgi:hypothetical protein